LTLIEKDDCWEDHYGLTLALHNATAEVAYASGKSELVDEMVDAVMKNGRSFDDQIQAISTRLYMLGTADRPKEATDLCLEVLEQLGERFPKNPTLWHVAIDILRTQRLLSGKTDAAFLRYRMATDTQKLAAMQIMVVGFNAVFFSKPMLSPLFCTRMVRISLKYGFSATTCVAFAYYGLILCDNGYDVAGGTRFGNLSLKLLDRFQAKEWIPRVYGAVYGFIHSWTKPCESALEPLRRGYRIGLETGDIEFAILDALLDMFYQFAIGTPLADLDRERSRFHEEMKRRHQTVSEQLDGSLAWTIRHLMGTETASSYSHVEEVMQETREGVPELPVDNWARKLQALICFLLCDYEGAVAQLAASGQPMAMESIDMTSYSLCDSLAKVAHFKESGRRNRRLVAQARRYGKVLNRIARTAKDFCLGKHALLQAELASLSPRKKEAATRNFLFAISYAEARNNRFDAAIAHETYGRYLEMCGDLSLSLEHLRRAYSFYHDWNVYRKSEALQAEIDRKSAESVPLEMPSYGSERRPATPWFIHESSMNLSVQGRKRS